MRLCFECLKRHPLSEFSKNSGMADGYLRQCNACVRERNAVYREKNRDAIKAYQRAWENRPDVAARTKQRLAAWREQHPQRRSAQVAVNNAVRDGRLTKQPCWVCGEKAQAHHPDYSRPLDVVWLCVRHHRETHMLVAA